MQLFVLIVSIKSGKGQVSWTPIGTLTVLSEDKDGMRILIHQRIHCRPRQNVRSSEKEMVFGNITFDTSIYTMDHP